VVPVRILLVDDHVDTLTTMARLLSRLGHGVVTAKTCAEALSAFGQQEFDLVVSDLGLPDATGYDLMAKIRETSRVPALAMSGYGMESDVALSLEAGFDEHLTKPVDLKVLNAKISKLSGGR
jgi:CheY-like chemotaxis protein